MTTDPGALRILVVDDWSDVADSLAVALSMIGFEVSTAYDGDTALRAIFDKSPDVVILDLLLSGLDGYQLAHAVRDDPRCRDIRLIAHTGDGSRTARERCAAAGFDLYVLKPIGLDDLVEAILSLMRGHRERERAFRCHRASE